MFDAHRQPGDSTNTSGRGDSAPMRELLLWPTGHSPGHAAGDCFCKLQAMEHVKPRGMFPETLYIPIPSHLYYRLSMDQLQGHEWPNFAGLAGRLPGVHVIINFLVYGFLVNIITVDLLI